ncbi:PI-PLC X domain-containing protein 2 isoform X2 [Leptinotarsa decemlineata]
MLIPGTHNSGSFAGVVAFLEDYVLNQDRSVWTQLAFGIRYLDFRIGYYNGDGFFINHDLIRVTKVIPLLKEIKKFLQLAPKEIVFLDFHRFPYPTNFTYNLHKKFIDIVYEELGIFALPSTSMEVGGGPTVNEVWKQNKTLIISYADKDTVRDNPWLWHPLSQYWGDTTKVPALKNYIQKTINERNPLGSTNPNWALMAELTPRPIDIIFRRNGLRKLAHDANVEVTKWFRDQWGKKSNIVATDYFLGNDMINVAMSINSS